jgi:hypothetical protein
MKDKNRSSLIILGLVVIVMILLFKKDQWSGYFYPDRENLSSWIESPTTFKSLDLCRAWAHNKATELNLETGQYDYECGLNCKIKDGMNICKKTLD